MTSQNVSVVREDFWECECCECCEWRLLRDWVLWENSFESVSDRAMNFESLSVVSDDFWEFKCWLLRVWLLWVMTSESVSVGREDLSFVCYEWLLLSVSVVSDDFWKCECCERCCEWCLLRVSLLWVMTFESVCCEWLFLRVLVLWEMTFESGNGKKMRKWIMTSESVSVVREDFWECECCEWRLEIVSVVRELFSECECFEWWLLSGFGCGWSGGCSLHF